MIGFLQRRNHDRLRTLLSSYIDGEVSSAEATKVEEHLATCEECRIEVESLRSTVSVFRSLPELTIPRSFVLAEAPKPVRSTSRMAWATRLATSAAALLLFALVLGDAFGFVTQSTPTNIQMTEFARPASERAESVPSAPMAAAPAPAGPPGPAAPAQPMPAASPTWLPQAGNSGLPGSPGIPGPAVQSAPMAAVQAAPQTPAPMSQYSAVAEPTPAEGAAEENLSVPESAPAPVMGLAAQAPASAPQEDETLSDTNMRSAQSRIEEIEKGQEGSPDAVSSNPMQEDTLNSDELQQQMPASSLLEEPNAASTRLPFSLRDNSGNPLQSASIPGEVGDTQVTIGADSTAANEPQGLTLPLRELEIAFGVTLVLLLIASLLIARNNRIWPFSQ